MEFIANNAMGNFNLKPDSRLKRVKLRHGGERLFGTKTVCKSLVFVVCMPKGIPLGFRLNRHVVPVNTTRIICANSICQLNSLIKNNLQTLSQCYERHAKPAE